MAKYKFNPEDFEKPESHNITETRISKWKKPLGIAISIVLLCSIGYGGYTLWNHYGKGDDVVPTDIVSLDTLSSQANTDNSDIDKQESTVLAQTLGNAENDVADGISSQADKVEVISKETGLSKEEHRVIEETKITGTLEQKAKHVIRGDYGNGQERRDRLGAEYDAIQKKVNEMYRNGDIYM